MAELGRRDIDVLLCESTNSEKQVFSVSEKYIINEIKKIIDNENIWLEMLNTRNLTSYVYDENTASKILNDICEKFWCELEKLYFCIV